MSDAPAVLLADVPQSNALLQTLLDISLTGVLLLRPLYAEAAETAPLVDFAYVHLNPAAQQMLQLPACPAESFLTLFPTAQDAGVFGFYRDTFLSGRVGRHQQNYQFDGLDGYYRLVAQRQEQLLVISFTDTNDQPRTAVEQALRTSQARAQQARAEAETQRCALQRLFAQAPVPMALFEGPDYRIELANESMAAVWGSTLSQFVGRPVFEALPFVRGQGFEAIFAEVLAQGTPYDLHEVLVTLGAAPASRQGYFNLTYRPQRDAHGRITGIITSAYEVTEQVEARRHVEQLNLQLEAARAAAERERAQLQALLTQAPVAIALLQGEDLRVVSANALMAELWGSTPAQVVGQPLLEGVPELQGQGFDDLLRQVLHTQVPHTGAETPAVMLRHGRLQTSYFDFVYHPLYEADGQVLGVIIVATDMTEQVLARRQVEQLNAELDTRVQARTADLQESEGRFRTMADTAPAMLWVTDPDGQCTYLNAQWYQYTGQTEAEALGMGWTQAVHPDDAALARQKFLDANAQRARFYVRYRLRRHDGVYRWAVDAGSPHFAEDGAYAGIVGTVIDIHEQQLAEDELLATNEQLRRTNVDLDNFIYTASHDLKAPITNIEGLLLALEHELPAAARPGDVPLMLTMMQEAIERFQRTITHLTDLSRLQKEHNPTSAAVALAPVVKAVRLDLGPLLTHTHGQLTVTIPEGLTVTFAEKNLRSVVYNLLSNALKYHHPDRQPAVHLRSWLADGYAVLEVQDNGLGLDLSQGQEQLFAMFQRLHTHVEGTGIGLYMVKRILENAGGRIEVDSQLGQGSTFRVYFRR